MRGLKLSVPTRRLLAAVILICNIGALSLYPGSAGSSLAQDADSIKIVRFEPSAVPGIDAGTAQRFRVEVAYDLKSEERALLTVFLFENNGDQLPKASGMRIPVAAGQGEAAIELAYDAPWYGITSVKLVAVLFKADQTLLAWAATEAIPVNPTRDKTLFDEAVADFENERFAEAVDKLTQAIEIAPSVANYYQWRGDAYARLGDYSQAVQDYDKALQIAPDYRPSLINRGIAKMWLNQWPAAIADLDRAVSLQSPDLWTAWAYRARGISRAVAGQRSEAAADFRAYLELWPQAPDRTTVLDWIAALN